MRQAAPRQLAGIEGNTTGIKILLDSFEIFPSIVKKMLVEKGVVEPGTDGRLLTKERWFPLESWLGVLEAIYKEIGPNAILSLGSRITQNPNFPPGIRDVPSALYGLDIAYHRSHRKSGVVMYDAVTGQMMEGIGHYRTRVVLGKKIAEVTCDTPYLCEVDFSILSGTVKPFEPRAEIAHAVGECKKNGDAACKFTVTW